MILILKITIGLVMIPAVIWLLTGLLLLALGYRHKQSTFAARDRPARSTAPETVATHTLDSRW